MRPGFRFIGFPPIEEKKRFLRFVVEPDGAVPAIGEWTDLLALPEWKALYDLAGNRIDVTKKKYVAGDLPRTKHILDKIAEKGDPRDNPDVIDVPADYDVVEHPVFYAGVAFAHFGHFLTDGVSRFWALPQAGNLPAVYLDYHEERFASLDFPKPVMETVGLSPERIIRIDRPTLFRRIIIPTPSIQHAHRIYRNHDYAHRLTASKLLRGRKSAWSGERIYLSRSALDDALRKSTDELALEARLEAKGFRIVYPEKLALVEQIDIFNNAEIVAGLQGSAFHSAMFSLPESRTRLAILCREKTGNRFLMQDCIKHYEVTYISCYGNYRWLSEGQFANLSIDVDAAVAGVDSA